MDAKELMLKNQNSDRIKQLYQIKDVKVGFLATPFEQPNNLAAIRAFGELVNKDQNLYSHAEDYQLYYVGEQSEQTGELKSAVVFLENAVNVKLDKMIEQAGIKQA